MPRVQQIIVFEGHNCGTDLKNRRIAQIEPPVAELSVGGGAGLNRQLFLCQYSDFLRYERGNYDITGWKILSRHVHKIFQHSKRDGLGHVHDRSSGRVPTASDALGAFAV